MKKLVLFLFLIAVLIPTAVIYDVSASEATTALYDTETVLSDTDDLSDLVEETQLPCEAESLVSLDGKTVMVVGNSMLYYGNCVIHGEAGKSDEGYLYQLISSFGENATVIDHTYSGKTLKYIYSNYLKDISSEELEKVDYVILAEANKSTDNIPEVYRSIRALFPEKTEFFFMCHPMMYYNNLEIIISGVEELRNEDIEIIDWGRLVYDVFSGNTAVPGSTMKFDFCSFIKDNTFVKDAKGKLIANPNGDNKHPNPLSGYVCAQMIYSAITNRSALYSPYVFCFDTDINTAFNIDAFALKHYSGDKTTNFTDIFRSPADMFGLQTLMDKYLAEEGEHLLYVFPSIEPTCTSGGLSQGYFCSVCGETVREQEYIQSLGGHKIVYNKAVAPTCTKAGKSGSAYCSVCKEIIVNATTLKATGHSDTVALKPATTASNGRRTVSCTVCKAVISDVKIPKITSISLSKSVYAYDGKSKKPKVIVKNAEGKLLDAEKDYTVNYPSGRKELGNYTVTIEFKGKYSGTETRVFKIRPGVPSQVKAVSSTDSIKLTWKKVEGASGYKVFIYNSKKKKYVEYATTKKTSLNVKKLKAATKYKFRVKAYTDVGNKRYNSDSHVYLQTATMPLKTELTYVSNNARGQVTLRWNKVKGADGYRILYSTDSKLKSPKRLTVSDGEKVSEAVNNLKSGKKYYFKIRAFKKVGSKKVYGNLSKVKSVAVRW